jgi:hypothetical protein
MAVVIHQMEGTVEPESRQAGAGGSDGGGPKAQQAFAADRMEAEILRIERRHARLRAD